VRSARLNYPADGAAGISLHPTAAVRKVFAVWQVYRPSISALGHIFSLPHSHFSSRLAPRTEARGKYFYYIYPAPFLKTPQLAPHLFKYSEPNKVCLIYKRCGACCGWVNPAPLLEQKWCWIKTLGEQRLSLKLRCEPRTFPINPAPSCGVFWKVLDKKSGLYHNYLSRTQLGCLI